jgi:hypothetical protein
VGELRRVTPEPVLGWQQPVRLDGVLRLVVQFVEEAV